MIQHARERRRPASAASASSADEPGRGQEPIADEFLARWAEDCAAVSLVRGAGADDALTTEELLLVARYAAPLFGHRPLGGLTFGELAALPTLLESHGFAPEASRAACRALGNAIRAALIAWPDTRH